MKRRLFAAAMAMTMVMASSIPTMALTDTTENGAVGEQKETSIAVTATVTDHDVADTGTYTEIRGDKDNNVWIVDILANELTYKIDKNSNHVLSGSYTWKWDPNKEGGAGYVIDSTTDSRDSTPTVAYAFDSTETTDAATHRIAQKTFRIDNHSNFALSRIDYAPTNSISKTGETALTTASTHAESINTSAFVTQTAYLDLDKINLGTLTSSVDGTSNNIGSIGITFTAGAKVVE